MRERAFGSPVALQRRGKLFKMAICLTRLFSGRAPACRFPIGQPKHHGRLCEERLAQMNLGLHGRHPNVHVRNAVEA